MPTLKTKMRYQIMVILTKNRNAEHAGFFDHFSCAGSFVDAYTAAQRRVCNLNEAVRGHTVNFVPVL
ncbi:hypothetical protein SDC9_204624 [bioreactor metagenome]|uniref:Uncharacterized protein n=1 Tax=bioreactor metagenome TaxID=1076179 RepID=A0A645J030_9ZZZZ